MTVNLKQMVAEFSDYVPVVRVGNLAVRRACCQKRIVRDHTGLGRHHKSMERR